jgi:hypothetical protein
VSLYYCTTHVRTRLVDVMVDKAPTGEDGRTFDVQLIEQLCPACVDVVLVDVVRGRYRRKDPS